MTRPCSGQLDGALRVNRFWLPVAVAVTRGRPMEAIANHSVERVLGGGGAGFAGGAGDVAL